ncbi:MAG: DUF4012 domain-containing protein [Anaerolineales bacterium]|nr:DUF4012 domain-containing protein [Anaerolineales bacterium]
MMSEIEISVKELRKILKNIHTVELLDSHPWTGLHFVKEYASRIPGLSERCPGERLLRAVAEVFREMIPPSPPKRGVRIDAGWSKFGFLAAKYFSSILYGEPVPETFIDAWTKIDCSIFLFVYGKTESDLSEDEINTYKLIGDEPEVTPNSTLSDWHRKGLQTLVDIIQVREKHLSAQPEGDVETEALQEEAVLSPDQKELDDGGLWKEIFASPDWFEKIPFRRIFTWGVIVILLVGVLKGVRFWLAGKAVYRDVTQLQEIVDYPSKADAFESLGPVLDDLDRNLGIMSAEAEPFLWITPALSWVPEYGCELKSAGDLMDLANGLTDAGLDSYNAVQPIMTAYLSDETDLNLSLVTEMLIEAQPEFENARNRIEDAKAARGNIDTGCMSPQGKELLESKVDLALTLMDGGLAIAVELPGVIGASSEGPKTYLILVQNEDELRPTGGFISAVGTVLFNDGRIQNLEFQGSERVDNWSKLYPAAPWQLRYYMNTSVLTLRDSNWFTDYPVTALYAESLYSLFSEHSVDGVIAVDQRALVELLTVLGPVHVKGSDYPITSENVVPFMRDAKTPTKEALADIGRDPKYFVGDLAAAMIDRLLSGDVEWERLYHVTIDTLNQHHVLLQFDNNAMQEFVSRNGWDGAVKVGDGDFLMVVDSNIGFNKTNAVVTASITYDIDLTDEGKPSSTLTVTHHNDADSKVPCIQWDGLTLEGQEYYPIDRCYWDYMRVYLPEDIRLLDASVQEIPADWMILGQEVPDRVDELKEEIPGVQVFGTLKVVRGGKSVTSEFNFSLPERVVIVQSGNRQKQYSLKVQKQPGTLAVPISIRVHLPGDAKVKEVPTGAVVQDGNVLLETTLQEDLAIIVIYR